MTSSAGRAGDPWQAIRRDPVPAQAQVIAAREGLQLAEQELAQAQRRYQAGVTTSCRSNGRPGAPRARAGNQITALLHDYNAARISTATGTIQDFVEPLRSQR